jgi:hypothetical protein
MTTSAAASAAAVCVNPTPGASGQAIAVRGGSLGGSSRCWVTSTVTGGPAARTASGLVTPLGSGMIAGSFPDVVAASVA